MNLCYTISSKDQLMFYNFDVIIHKYDYPRNFYMKINLSKLCFKNINDK